MKFAWLRQKWYASKKLIPVRSLYWYNISGQHSSFVNPPPPPYSKISKVLLRMANSDVLLSSHPSNTSSRVQLYAHLRTDRTLLHSTFPTSSRVDWGRARNVERAAFSKRRILPLSKAIVTGIVSLMIRLLQRKSSKVQTRWCVSHIATS